MVRRSPSPATTMATAGIRGAASGGEPRRLTYTPADFGVVGWTPDGKRILFSSARAAFAGGVVQLFTVPVQGGYATQVPLTRASEASYSADGTRVAYVPNIQWQARVKRYRGGQTKPSGSRILPTPASRPQFLGTIPMTSSSVGR